MLIYSVAAAALLGKASSVATAAAAAAAVPSVVLSAPDSLSPQAWLAAQVCSGLYNRDASADATTVYSLVSEPYSSQWLADIEGVLSPEITPTEDFINSCLGNQKLVQGFILYDYATQQALLPNLVTLAAVLDAVPLEAADAALILGAGAGAEPPVMVFDATAAWAGFTPLQATEYMFVGHVSETSTLAFMNPGYDNAADPSSPPLSLAPRLKLVDYLVKERLFTIYLNDACVPNTDEHTFMSALVSHNPWPSPIPVYGYNDAYPLAGDIFEAETGCTPEHNMGQVASIDSFNLAYWSRKETIDTPQKQNSEEALIYNSSKTYINFVMGKYVVSKQYRSIISYY
jgi:hypothetical protein